jgi:hypothetical protein
MTLPESMHELAKVLCSMPSDLTVEVSITTKVHDDVPPMFVEDGESTYGQRYKMIVDTKDGIATKYITLYIRD